MSADVFDPDFPKLDVAPDEKREDDNSKSRANKIGDHQQPVEQAVSQHSPEQGRHQVTETAFSTELGQREKISHDDSKEEMSWHGKQSPDDTSAHTALINVKDVLHTGKAQPHKGGINDAVHVFVEILVPPDGQEEDDKLA